MIRRTVGRTRGRSDARVGRSGRVRRRPRAGMVVVVMVRDDDDDDDEGHRSFVGATRRRFFFSCFFCLCVCVRVATRRVATTARWMMIHDAA